MRLLEHSQDTFNYDVVVPEDQKILAMQRVHVPSDEPRWTSLRKLKQLVKMVGNVEKMKRNKKSNKKKKVEAHYKVSTKRSSQVGRIEDIWSFAIAGDVAKIQRLVALHDLDVRRHNDRDGGSTMLHYAAWFAQVHLVKWLISQVRQLYGPDALESFANVKDSCAHRSTPLIELARNNIGHLTDRLEILQCLLNVGARICERDASGDTCLMWAVRRRNLPVVRYIITHCDDAAVALRQRNYSSCSALDIAMRIAEDEKAKGSGKVSEKTNRLIEMLSAN